MKKNYKRFLLNDPVKAKNERISKHAQQYILGGYGEIELPEVVVTCDPIWGQCWECITWEIDLEEFGVLSGECRHLTGKMSDTCYAIEIC